MLDIDNHRKRLGEDAVVNIVERFIDPWISGSTSERASNFVHSTSEAVENTAKYGGPLLAAAEVGVGLTALGAGGWIVAAGVFLAGIVGAAIGGVVGGFLGDVVESVGGAIVNMLGMDFITNGKTPGGGDWLKEQHPDGTWRRVEHSDGLTITDWTDGNGSHQTIDGNSYHSDYHSNETGTTFNARDSEGGYHGITTDRSGNYVTADSDGKGNSTVHTSDGKGNSSTFTTHTDKNGGVTTTETNTTNDEKNGTTTTTKTVTHPDGTTETTTTTTDENGDPVDPPKKDDGGMENPDEGGNERPRVKPGELGRPRPGHPDDLVLAPGKADGAGDDYNEGPRQFYVSLSAAIQGMALVMSAGSGTGWGDSDGNESADDIRRKLSEITYNGTTEGTGEDFIHPKARGELLGRMARAIIIGRL